MQGKGVGLAERPWRNEGFFNDAVRAQELIHVQQDGQLANLNKTAYAHH
jgi:hypothetical protein